MNLQDGDRAEFRQRGWGFKIRDLKPEWGVVLNRKVGLKLKSLVLTIIRDLK